MFAGLTVKETARHVVSSERPKELRADPQCRAGDGLGSAPLSCSGMERTRPTGRPGGREACLYARCGREAGLARVAADAAH